MLTSRFGSGGARLLLAAFALSACAPFGQGAQSRPGKSPLLDLPHTVVGSVSFSPPTGTVEFDPAKPVVVRSAESGATIKNVTVLPDGGGTAVPGKMEGDLYTVREGLRTDTKYTVTAVVTQRPSGAASPVDETQSSDFSTATTPKITATTPLTVGSGQAVTLTLQPAASAISVEGPVRANLAPDGTTVTMIPAEYKQGQAYIARLTAKNLKGISGPPQTATFNSLPPATAYMYPDPGSTNMGVAIPMTVTLSQPPADRSDFTNHLTVSADVHGVNVPNISPNDLCNQYQVSQVASGSLAVGIVWITDRRVRLVPKTPDGYWPAGATISLSGSLNGVKTSAGNWFDQNLNGAFGTGDKRVIDVDLSRQQLTACKDGAVANAFPISSGTAAHPTYAGTFYIYRRVQDEEMKSPEGQFAPDYYDIKHVPWTQYFDGGAALHGAWWHNNFGNPMSHGCVNVMTPTMNTKWPNAQPQAEYLWNFDYLGDPVMVHGVTPGLTAGTQPSD